MNGLKRLASRLPSSWQQELKRLYYRRQIHRLNFKTTEPEFLILDQLVSAGDWVIDVGANVGHYTKRFSDLVGPKGRVIALEPVPSTFALLAANTSLFQYSNVTLLNLAASDQTTSVGIEIPKRENGLKNYYRATISSQNFDFDVIAIALDQLGLVNRIGLIKIDAEGHDPVVLQGLDHVLVRDHPTLIVETETNSGVIIEKLADLGYSSEKLPNSPNTIFRCLPDSTLDS